MGNESMVRTAFSHAVCFKHWTPLQPGDRVAIVALSGHPGDFSLTASAVELLQKMTGWRVDLVGWPAPASSSDPFSALAYLDRKQALLDALTGPYRLVWTLRGGYGSTPLLADMPASALTDHPRFLLGFSDTTALHALWRRWGWASIHADGLLRWAAHLDKNVPCPLLRWLSGELTGWRRPIFPANQAAKQIQILEGRTVWGGNMAVQLALEGTHWAMRAAEGMALFEDVHEAGYKMDRAWHHWMQAGGADSVAGVLWGDFTQAADKDGVDRSSIALVRWGEALDRKAIPAWVVPQLGHGPVHWPLMMGAPITAVRGNQLWQHCPWAQKEDAWHHFASA